MGRSIAFKSFRCVKVNKYMIVILDCGFCFLRYRFWITSWLREQLYCFLFSSLQSYGCILVRADTGRDCPTANSLFIFTLFDFILFCIPLTKLSVKLASDNFRLQIWYHKETNFYSWFTNKNSWNYWFWLNTWRSHRITMYLLDPHPRIFTQFT